MKGITSNFKGDKIIWGIVVILIVISLVSVYSSIGSIAYRYKAGNTNYYITRHFFLLCAGITLMFITHKMPYTILYHLCNLILIAAGILLVYTFIAGKSEYGAKRWAEIGGQSFQTSDIAKFAIVIFISKTLAMSQENKETLFKAFKKIMWVVGIASALIFSSNLSTVILLFGASMVLMFIGNIPIKYLAYSTGIALLLAILAIFFSPQESKLARSGTWEKRITSFFGGDENKQVVLAKNAIASSALWGKGPGNSAVKYKLENASTDFIFPIIIEELGSLIGIIVLILYLVLLFRVKIIVKNLDSIFPALLAIGLTLNIIFQALVNMSVGVSIIPVTGQPLPLVSWGGTSLLLTFISLGVILNISNKAKQNKMNAA